MISNPNGPVIIVDPYSSGAFYAPAFIEAGVPVIAVQSSPLPPQVYATSHRPQDFKQCFVVDSNIEEIVVKLKEINPRCVLPGCESGVELADVLAPLVTIDVANVPKLSKARRHKGAMSDAVRNSGLPIIAQINTNSEKDINAWILKEELANRDLVIKPPKSASTDGVTRIPQGKEWQKIFYEMIGTTNRLGIINDTLIIQEYVTGIEYVVDTMTYNGKHSICNVCQYTKINNGQYMAIYDRMEWMSPDIPIYNELIEYTRGVLDAVGIKFGASHVELMYTPKGIRLIEIGARPHGGGHPRFNRVATSDSQIDRIVRYFTGFNNIPDGFTLKRHMLVVFLICRKAGVVRNTEVFNEIHELKSFYDSIINIHNYDYIEPTKDLFASLDLGFIVLSHDNRNQIMQDYQQIRKIEKNLIINDF